MLQGEPDMAKCTLSDKLRIDRKQFQRPVRLKRG